MLLEGFDFISITYVISFESIYISMFDVISRAY